jgi:hypothetical protein
MTDVIHAALQAPPDPPDTHQTSVPQAQRQSRHGARVSTSRRILPPQALEEGPRKKPKGHVRRENIRVSHSALILTS